MKQEKCRLCLGKLSEPVLSLPDTPLANEFVKEPIRQDTFPLQICVCNDCGHYQLNETVDPERLFRNYLFVAGTSPVNVKHFKSYASNMVEKFNLRAKSKILDIASNDGTLLQAFKDLGMRVLGIDPAENIAKIANENGIETIPEFFTEAYADVLLDKYGQFDLITANNVFAHVPDMIGFAKGVKKLLAPDGVFSFEISYFADVCEKNLFDTIYHEHTSYHTFLPLVTFFYKHDLRVLRFEKVDTHGGSLRIFVKNKTRPDNESRFELTKILAGRVVPTELEIQKEVGELQSKIKTLGTKLKMRLEELKQQGKSIAIYGVPAKATTLMYAFDLNSDLIDFAVDDAPLKQGMYTPGKHIPVYSSKAIDERKPDVLLILAWNFADSIRKNHSEFKGRWIVPLPELREYVK